MNKFILLSISIVYFFFTNVALAHIEGISIFTINGLPTEVLPPQAGEATEGWVLPEESDLAPQKYEVNQKLDFAIDLSKFITPKSTFEKTDLIWDFGDGTEKQTLRYGRENSHAYSKAGRYILMIHADYTPAGLTTFSEPQLLQAVIIDVQEPSDQLKLIKNNTVLVGVSIGIVGLSILFYKKQFKGKRKEKGNK